LVTSVRGMPLEPITAASVALGVIGFMNAAFGLRPPFFLLAFFAIENLPDRCAVNGAGGWWSGE
jgi:hypothetical protein